MLKYLLQNYYARNNLSLSNCDTESLSKCFVHSNNLNMFQLITPTHHKKLSKIVKTIKNSTISEIVDNFYKLIEQIRSDIPEKKKISYGRYSIIKKMGLELHPLLIENMIDIFKFCDDIFKNTEHNQFVRSLAIQVVSVEGLKEENLSKVLIIFKKAASDEKWEMRECSTGFIRKLIKKHTIELKKWYLTQVKSENPLLRRFVSESIRPVADNKWFKQRPEFCFAIIENLYAEKAAYPRTSVGNNLSDWSRIDKEKVFKIVEKLVKSKDKNSYWIAYRACRNLVKTEPIRVMDLLKIDEYKYKKRLHYRKDYQK